MRIKIEITICLLMMLHGVFVHVADAQSPSAQTQPTVEPAALPAAAKASKPKPTKEVALTDCTTAGCHASVLDYKVVHGPVNVNSCDACHKLTDASKHSYTFVREKTQLCTFCHQVDTSFAKVVHKPVANGECIACHNPHGGFNNRFLRGNSTRETCANCHKDVSHGKKNVHGPVAAGACESCHAPHMSELPKLLVRQGRDLCVTCHREMEDQLTKSKFVHKAVTEGDCQSCHDAHSSDFRMQLKKNPSELCITCHASVKKAIEETHKHSAVTADLACLNCHTAHGGDLPKLMKKKQIELCMNCHKKSISVDATHTVASVAEVIDPKMNKHGPIRDGECAGCHNPHGSANDKLLLKPYPAVFYQPFDLEKYALCFTCHDKQLVLLKNTENLTGFRNGATNLHFLHVNKTDRGRSCRACHSVHASKYPLHLRESVPYGNWQLPINNVPTPTGGSCAPGCHRKMGYDRIEAIDNTLVAQPPPANPASPAAPSNPRAIF